MKLRTKQISLGALAAVTIVAVPVATVIACGSESKDDSVTPPKYDMSKTIVIDATSMKSPKELITKINKELNLTMPENAYKMAEHADPITDYKLLKPSFDKIEKYMNNIKIDKKLVVLKFGDQYIEWKLDKMINAIEGVKKSIKLGFSKLKVVNPFTLMLKDNNPVAMYILAQSTNTMEAGVGVISFASLPLNTKAGIDGFKSYNEMLAAYHELSIKLLSTNAFKEWIKGKKYEFWSYANSDGVPSNPQEFAPGTRFDDKKQRAAILPKLIGANSSKFVDEGNNFEAQWILSVMGVTK